MNADISFNNKVANQGNLHRASILAKIQSLAEILEVENNSLVQSDVDPQLSENNTSLALIDLRLGRLLEQL